MSEGDFQRCPNCGIWYAGVHNCPKSPTRQVYNPLGMAEPIEPYVDVTDDTIVVGVQKDF